MRTKQTKQGLGRALLGWAQTPWGDLASENYSDPAVHSWNPVYRPAVTKNTNWQEIALGELGRGRNGCGEQSVVQFLFFQTSICVLSLQLRSPGFRVGILAIFWGNNYVMLGVRICPCSQLTCDQASLYFRGGKAKKKIGTPDRRLVPSWLYESLFIIQPVPHWRHKLCNTSLTRQRQFTIGFGFVSDWMKSGAHHLEPATSHGVFTDRSIFSLNLPRILELSDQSQAQTTQT